LAIQKDTSGVNNQAFNCYYIKSTQSSISYITLSPGLFAGTTSTLPVYCQIKLVATMWNIYTLIG
jgi:hypothetical protein